MKKLLYYQAKKKNLQTVMSYSQYLLLTLKKKMKHLWLNIIYTDEQKDLPINHAAVTLPLSAANVFLHTE